MQDKLANPTDCHFLQDELIRNGVTSNFHLYNKCDHMTFMWGRYPQEIFYDVLNEVRDIEGKDFIIWDPEIHGGINWEKYESEKAQTDKMDGME